MKIAPPPLFSKSQVLPGRYLPPPHPPGLPTTMHYFITSFHLIWYAHIQPPVSLSCLSNKIEPVKHISNDYLPPKSEVKSCRSLLRQIFTWNNELRNLLWDSFPAGVVPDAGAATAVCVNGNVRMLVWTLNILTNHNELWIEYCLLTNKLNLRRISWQWVSCELEPRRQEI